MTTISITSQTEEPLLHRVKIEAAIADSHATPSKAEIHAAIAKEVKADPSLVVVRHVATSFGTRDAKAFCYYYKDRKYREKLEGKIAEKKAEAKPAAAKDRKSIDAKKE
ncbi:TPA: hypothetical protein HA361_00870 [Candidatus Woesearchaeota archaeon]|nr:hypothetical protein [Candidatus Woesearchaeota archaeon]